MKTKEIILGIVGFVCFILLMGWAGEEDRKIFETEKQLEEERKEILEEARYLKERDDYLREHPEEFESKEEWSDWCSSHPEKDIFEYQWIAEEDYYDHR